MVEHAEEIARRVFQPDDERVRVRGFETDLGEIGDLAVIVFAGVDDLHIVEAHAGVRRSERGLEDALVGQQEILRGDGVAVAPLRVVTQMEGVRAPAVGDVPVFGHAGDGVEVPGVLRDESLEERVEDVALGFADDGLRVETSGVAAVAPEEDLFVVALADATAFADTAGKAAGEKQRLGDLRKFPFQFSPFFVIPNSARGWQGQA